MVNLKMARTTVSQMETVCTTTLKQAKNIMKRTAGRLLRVVL